MATQKNNVLRGQIKAGKGPLIGAAGEYFVVGELLRRGIVAALAPRNTPGFDVIVAEGSKSVNIRVKTKTNAANSWVWIAKRDGIIFRGSEESLDNDFTVLVDLGDGRSPVEYFVVPTSELEAKLRRDFEEWLSKPGLRGKPHSPTNRMYRIGYSEGQRDWLEINRGKWSVILHQLGPNAP